MRTNHKSLKVTVPFRHRAETIRERPMTLRATETHDSEGRSQNSDSCLLTPDFFDTRGRKPRLLRPAATTAFGRGSQTLIFNRADQAATALGLFYWHFLWI
jgi:hypothetical protein